MIYWLLLPAMVYVWLQLNQKLPLPAFKHHCPAKVVNKLLKHRNRKTGTAATEAVDHFVLCVEKLEILAMASHTPSVRFEYGREFLVPNSPGLPDSPDLDLDEFWETQVFDLRLQCFQLCVMAKDSQHKLLFMYLASTNKVATLHKLSPSVQTVALVKALQQ